MLDNQIPGLQTQLQTGLSEPTLDLSVKSLPLQPKILESGAVSTYASGSTDISKPKTGSIQNRPRSNSLKSVSNRRDSARPNRADSRKDIPTPFDDHTSGYFDGRHAKPQDREFNFPQNARPRCRSTSRMLKPFDVRVQDTSNTGQHPAGLEVERQSPMFSGNALAKSYAPSPVHSSSKGIWKGERRPTNSRPTTPSAIPRPVSRMSLPGTRTPSRTASRSSDHHGDGEPSTPTKRSFTPLGCASPSSHRHSRSVSGPAYGLPAALPPVPPLPSRQELAAKEALRASCLSSFPSAPASHTAFDTYKRFHHGARSVSMTSPERTRTGSFGLGLRETLGSPSRMKSSPSSFRFEATNPSRPSSSMSTSARSKTPTPGVMAKAFVPNPLDELDKEVARILESLHIDVQVERMDPPLRKGQLHEGEWKAQYALVAWGERKVHACRLLELTRSGSSHESMTRKVMIRDKGGQSSLPLGHVKFELTFRFAVWIDLRQYFRGKYG